MLKGLLRLRLWPGSLWAALSATPSEYSSEQPRKLPSARFIICNSTALFDLAIDSSLNPSVLVADAVKRSTKAHLFHFYTAFCDIVAIPRKTPSAWVVSQTPMLDDSSTSRKSIVRLESANTTDASSGKVVELDARQLARDCLKELAQEMGIAR